MSDNNDFIAVKNVPSDGEIIADNLSFPKSIDNNNNNKNDNNNNNNNAHPVTIDNALLKNDLIHSAHLEAEDDQSLSIDFEKDPIDEKPTENVNKNMPMQENNKPAKDFEGTLDPSV